MNTRQIVSHEEWVAARKELLRKEKEFTQLRDTLSQQIRDLPWERVEKTYVFDGPDGPESLTDLFAGKRQLVVYHFMFDPEWENGCKSCSLMADHFDPVLVHLQQRDVSLVAVSRAPLAKLTAFKQRMGWGFKWVSSHANEFNWDYHVSFTPAQVQRQEFYYNYQMGTDFPGSELPGLSVFYKDETATIFHTYSSFARGLDSFLGVYRFLDIVPKGRDEEAFGYGMEWVRHHDRYEGDSSE